MKRLRKYFRGGVQRIGLGLHGFIGYCFGPAYFVHPHDDGPWWIDGHNTKDDDRGRIASSHKPRSESDVCQPHSGEHPHDRPGNRPVQGVNYQGPGTSPKTKTPSDRTPVTDLDDNRIADLIGHALASTVLPSLSSSVIGVDRIRALMNGARPAFLMALPALVKLDETIADEAIKVLQKGLIPQHSHDVRAALTAVFWFEKFAKQAIIQVPDVLVS